MRKLSGASHDAFVACVASERLSCLKCLTPGDRACVFACLPMAPYVHKSFKYGGTLQAPTCRGTGSLRAELYSTILEPRASAHYDSHLVSQRGRIRSPCIARIIHTTCCIAFVQTASLNDVAARCVKLQCAVHDVMHAESYEFFAHLLRFFSEATSFTIVFKRHSRMQERRTTTMCSSCL